MDLRRRIRNVGGDRNDVARHADSTGMPAAETGQVQRMVARVVLQIDTAVVALLAPLGPPCGRADRNGVAPPPQSALSRPGYRRPAPGPAHPGRV